MNPLGKKLKPVLFIAQAEDISSQKILDWLDFLGGEVFPMSEVASWDEYLQVSVSLPGDVKGYSCFFRRWAPDYDEFAKAIPHQKELKAYEFYYESAIHDYLSEEIKVLEEYKVKSLFDGAETTLGIPFCYTVNKMRVLSLAKQEGLDIPKSWVATGEFPADSTKVTKAIGEYVEARYNNFWFQYEGVGPLDFGIHNASTEFPSLIQEYMPKAFEVRVFYIKGECYPMAIFSQSNSKTEYDYRNYDESKPNRNVPYQLPPDVEHSIIRLMERVGLDNGSIDIIVTPEGKHVFLEVNPEGQFDWVSLNCNYYLEEKAAKTLSHYAEE